MAPDAKVHSHHFECYRRLNANLDDKCASVVRRADRRRPPQLQRSPYTLMLRACELDAERAATEAVASVCGA